MVAVALKPRCSCFNGHGVAQRRLKDAPAVFFQASLRDATAGWVLLRGLKPTATVTASLREAESGAQKLKCTETVSAIPGVQGILRVPLACSFSFTLNAARARRLTAW